MLCHLAGMSYTAELFQHFHWCLLVLSELERCQGHNLDWSDFPATEEASLMFCNLSRASKI